MAQVVEGTLLGKIDVCPNPHVELFLNAVKVCHLMALALHNNTHYTDTYPETQMHSYKPCKCRQYMAEE